jgi:hypothetical protein
VTVQLFIFLLLFAGVVASVALAKGHRWLFIFGLGASVLGASIASAVIGTTLPLWLGWGFLVLYYGVPWTVGVAIGFFVREVFAMWVSSRRSF